jgi:small nuclear ribonucleoprotein (snRNP)-like protein
MKVIKEHRQCVSCRETKLWTQFNIQWGNSENSSYLRRICMACDSGTISNAEIRQLEKELKKCAKRRHTYTTKLEEVDEHINMLLKQLNTARNIPRRTEKEPIDTEDTRTLLRRRDIRQDTKLKTLHAWTPQRIIKLKSAILV